MAAFITDRLDLPFLDAGQAQKELTHNEALLLLDLLVQASVTAVGLNAPPAAPAIGARWIVGTAPTGAWSEFADALAMWTAGGWRMAPARTGMSVWSEADGMEAIYLDGVWTIGTVRAREVTIAGKTVLDARQPAIPEPAGGGTIDGEARATVGAMLAALRAHGLIER